MREKNIENFLKLGLINWLPMKSGAMVLVVGGCAEFAQDFQRRGLKAYSINNVHELVDIQTQYDYILICDGDSFLVETDKRHIDIKRMLKPAGHLFLACTNRLSLRNFVGDADPYTTGTFDGIENYCNYSSLELQNFSARSYARNEIEDYIKEWGFTGKQYRGYSIFPGLEMPQLIFAWDYLPREDLETRYTPLYNNATRIFLNESKIVNSLVKNGMFHAMANAYLLDCSVNENFYEFNQVTTSMERGEEHAMATILQKNGKVIKKALYPSGNSTIKNLVANMLELKQRGIATVGLEQMEIGNCDETMLLACQMDYIDAPLAIKYLQNLLYENKEKFRQAVCKFLDTIMDSGDVKEGEKTELGPIYRRVYFDLVPINCFVIDGEFVFFDQEYVIEDYPINAILMRVLNFLYIGNRSADQILPMSYFTKKYHLDNKQQIYGSMSAAYLDDLKHTTELIGFHSKHKADLAALNANRQKIQYDMATYISLFLNYLQGIQGKKVFLFGSGLWAQKFVAEYGDRVNISGMLDNNSAKCGTVVAGITVMEPCVLQELESDTYKVIICVKQYPEIVRQLNEMKVSNYGIYDPYVDVHDIIGDRQSLVIEDPQFIAEQGAKSDKVKQYHIGFVAGVFDLFHVGHLNLLRRAKEQCEILIVGVVSDEQACSNKKHSPYVSEQERLEIVKACRFVDKAFIMPRVAAGARDIYKKYHFDVMFSGDDYKDDAYWLGEREWLRSHGSDIVFFPYTQSTSSTKLKAAIEQNKA